VLPAGSLIAVTVPPSDPSISAEARTPLTAIVWLIVLLHALIVSRVFFPALSDIGAWDEAFYINEGRELAHGTIPRFSGNPAVATLYALTYLPVHSSPFWLVYSAGIGRVLLFVLLWLAVIELAHQMRRLAHPLILIALVAIAPILVGSTAGAKPNGLLNNGSSALFAAMSGLALAQFVAFYQDRVIRHLWRAAAFVALAALSRNEGTILALILVASALVISARTRIVRAALFACLAPLAAILGGYLLAYWLQNGRVSLGTAERSYLAFEQGHGMAFRDQFGPNALADLMLSRTASMRHEDFSVPRRKTDIPYSGPSLGTLLRTQRVFHCSPSPR
jgi:hypothetical protein